MAWADDDRAKLTAHLLERASRCQSCGSAQWEWDEDQYAYDVTEQRCHGCYLLEVASEDTSGRVPGSRVVLSPRKTDVSISDRPVARKRRKGGLS